MPSKCSENVINDTHPEKEPFKSDNDQAFKLLCDFHGGLVTATMPRKEICDFKYLFMC